MINNFSEMINGSWDFFLDILGIFGILILILCGVSFCFTYLTALGKLGIKYLKVRKQARDLRSKKGDK